MIYHVDVDPDDTDFFSVYAGHKGGESAEVAGKIRKYPRKIARSNVYSHAID